MHNRASKQIKTSEKNLILGRKEDKKKSCNKKSLFQDNWYTIFLFAKNLLCYVRGFDFIDKRSSRAAEVGKVIAKTGFCLTFAQLLLLVCLEGWKAPSSQSVGSFSKSSAAEHVRNYFHQIDVHVDTTTNFVPLDDAIAF